VRRWSPPVAGVGDVTWGHAPHHVLRSGFVSFILRCAGAGFDPSSGDGAGLPALLGFFVCLLCTRSVSPFFSCCFSWMCWLGLNPNPSTPVFPTVLTPMADPVLGLPPRSLLCFRTRSIMWPGLHRVKTPTLFHLSPLPPLPLYGAARRLPHPHPSPLPSS
jgi:hypothetical protein